MIANRRYYRKKSEADKFLAEQRRAAMLQRYQEDFEVNIVMNEMQDRERAQRQHIRSVLERMIWNLKVANADGRDALWALEQAIRAQLGLSAPPITKKVVQSGPSQIQRDLWELAEQRRKFASEGAKS